MKLLRDQNAVVEKEGAVWFASASLGANKDNVLIRSDGRPTYFASDIAYHYDKFFNRGFDHVIDIWGADHQGHVSRVITAVEALGIAKERIEIIIGQLVALKRGGDTVRFSKRAGEIITLREVIDEVGGDACRYFFLQRSADSQMDFDLELAKRQSSENPVYYVQYAHARSTGRPQQAAERGIELRGRRRGPAGAPGGADADSQDAAAAGAGRGDRGKPRAAPPAPLRARPRDGVPRLLREVPRAGRCRAGPVARPLAP